MLYRSSDMVIFAHSGAGFHNEIKGRSRAGAHIFHYENDHMTRWNVPGLTLYQNIKFVMFSAAEAELGVIFITVQDMVAMRKNMEEMRWPQPKSPIQNENSAAEGLFNDIIYPRN